MAATVQEPLNEKAMAPAPSLLVLSVPRHGLICAETAHGLNFLLDLGEVVRDNRGR